MENSTLISIALCTYNAGSYLERQIFSILEQTYKNIELVVVDDCSKDDTYIRLKALQQKHPQIKLFKNESNIGFNKNFEKAIGLCNGDFIAISDQDDIWLPNKLERLHQKIGDNWLAFSNAELIETDEKPMGIQLLKHSFSLTDSTFKSIILSNFVTGHTTLFSREFISYFMPIPSVGYYDWWMGFIALYHQKITYVNECLTLHRIHNTAVTGNIHFHDKKSVKRKISKDRATQLQLFTSYENLLKEDRKLIDKIYSSYKKRFSLYLVWLIVFQYSVYLPDQKPRNWLGRFFFALKLTRTNN